MISLLQRIILRLFNGHFDLDVEAEEARIIECRKALL